MYRLVRNTRHLLEITDQLHGKGVTLQIQNLGIDTATPTGKLMLTMIGAIATFEREIMLERQAEGIALAKAKGVYKGRKPSAREKGPQIMSLLAQGKSKSSISSLLGVSLSSIHRVVRQARI
ncbi:recombinase family protein [Aeromonas cavernicola]|uniref:recombinase family protein n=1 Tax=Aeromonas cavernicola TaxID=1006623 RepID=UPI001F1EFF1D|nr:recombinase family protein [Aeromonas cavernicola]